MTRTKVDPVNTHSN